MSNKIELVGLVIGLFFIITISPATKGRRRLDLRGVAGAAPSGE